MCVILYCKKSQMIGIFVPMLCRRIFFVFFSDFHTFDTGIKHGTVSVVINSSVYEITTFRIDGEYFDNRHPEKVEFTDDLVTDLSRRDFTVNAMAYSDRTGLVDPFDGAYDLELYGGALCR